MRYLAPLAALLTAACFSPDTSRIILLCDAQNLCPDGQSCVQGRCQAPPSLDMSSPLDGGADLSSGPGCAAGIAGSPVGSAWACPGAFAIGQASSHCRAGWSLCKDATKVDQVACNQLGGFFAAEAPCWSMFPGAAQYTCGQDPGSYNRGWYGCGQRSTYLSDGSLNHCQGFLKVLDCQPSSNWNCFSGTTLDKTSSTVATDGVLCCPN